MSSQPDVGLGELGWQGKFKYDSPDVVALRAQLDKDAGIPGLELIDPKTDPDFAEHAARCFNRDVSKRGICHSNRIINGADSLTKEFLLLCRAGFCRVSKRLLTEYSDSGWRAR